MNNPVKNPQEDKKQCLECNVVFIGRSDKKFCSDQCRSSYNNRINSESNVYIRSINKILNKNRKILAEINKDGIAKVKEDSLLARGFNFQFFTHTLNTKKGNTYFFCYDHGYIKFDNGWMTLVINKDFHVN